MEEVKNAAGPPGPGVDDLPEQAFAAGNGDPADSVQISDPIEQLAALAADRDRAMGEKAELQDLLLRRQAEFDNFRKRVERERFESLEFAGMEAVRSILPVVDDFDRAVRVECAGGEYARGMELIHQRLAEALKKLGLEPMETQGQTFDPNLHHAVTKEQSTEHEENTVLEEYQKGYHFKGRLLRPAMVKVSVRP